jgi:hypothetical protein
MDSRKNIFGPEQCQNVVLRAARVQPVMAGFKVSTLQIIEEEHGLGIQWLQFIHRCVSAAKTVLPIEPSSF